MTHLIDSYFYFFDKLLIEEKIYIIDKMKSFTEDTELSYFDLINSVPNEDFKDIVSEMKRMNEEYEQKEKEKFLNFIELTQYEII